MSNLSREVSIKNAMINDVLKYVYIVTIIHMLTKYRTGGQMFDEESVYSIIFTGVSVTLYYVIFISAVPVLPTPFPILPLVIR